jgi:lipid-A-disaccharide synthase
MMVFMARRLVHLNCAGLANIILGDRPVMPELMQEACTTENIVAAVLPLLRNEPPAQLQRHQFSVLRDILGERQAASGVVDMLIELSTQESS